MHERWCLWIWIIWVIRYMLSLSGLINTLFLHFHHDILKASCLPPSLNYSSGSASLAAPAESSHIFVDSSSNCQGFISSCYICFSFSVSYSFELCWCLFEMRWRWENKVSKNVPVQISPLSADVLSSPQKKSSSQDLKIH